MGLSPRVQRQRKRKGKLSQPGVLGKSTIFHNQDVLIFLVPNSACTVCRRLKMKCVGAESGGPCKRCMAGNHECIFEESNRGKRSSKYLFQVLVYYASDIA